MQYTHIQNEDNSIWSIWGGPDESQYPCWKSETAKLKVILNSSEELPDKSLIFCQTVSRNLPKSSLICQTNIKIASVKKAKTDKFHLAFFQT